MNTQKELLKYLKENDRVCTREELYEEIWDEERFHPKRRDRRLDATIWLLRRKHNIQTIQTVGYKYIGEIK